MSRTFFTRKCNSLEVFSYSLDRLKIKKLANPVYKLLGMSSTGYFTLRNISKGILQRLLNLIPQTFVELFRPFFIPHSLFLQVPLTA